MLEKSESKVLQQVGSFFGKVERTLFEAITWVVIVPSTLYRVLSSPKEVPDYVRGELTDDQPDTFQDSISPVFLYLLVALGPFLLIQLVNPRLAITPDDDGYFVDGTSTFTVTKTDGPYREDVVIRWDVVHTSALDSDTVMGTRADTIRVYRCGRGAQSDCSSEAERLFETMVLSAYAEEPSESVARAVRDSVADRFGAEAAGPVFRYWCSSPAWAGCRGYEPEKDFFTRAVLDDGETVDGAVALTAEEYGAELASEVAAYWCSPPAGDSCDGSRAGAIWESLTSLVDAGGTPDAAWVSGWDETDRPLADAVLRHWRKLDIEEAGPYALFNRLTEAGYSVDAARDSANPVFGLAAAASQAVFWCSPPAYDGCDGSTVEQAWREFRGALDSGASLDSATARVADIDAILAEVLYDRCWPAATNVGCMNQTPRTAADCVASGAEAKADSVSHSITCSWNRAGSFSVSASVRRPADGDLVDLSETLGGVVAPPAATLQSLESEPPSRGDPPEPEKPARDRVQAVLAGGLSTLSGDSRERPDLTTMLGETQTILIALAMLLLPLGMGLVTMPLGDGMKPDSIKPCFYMQCFYLAPVVLAIWIPFVLVNYVPELELGASLYLAVALILVLVVWLLLTEVDLLASERGVSRPVALVICLGALLVCTAAAVVLLDHESAGAALGLTKFNIAGYLGVGLAVLLLLPGVVGITRLVMGRKEAES